MSENEGGAKVTRRGAGEPAVRGGFRDLVTVITELLKSFALVVGALSATGIFLSLVPIPEAHFNCSSRWRVRPGWLYESRSVSFDDSAWPLAKAQQRSDFVLGEDRLPVLFGSLDSTMTTYRLTFHVADPRQVTDATLICGADDDLDVYVNGNKVVSEHDGMAGPITSSQLRRHLRKGANVIDMESIEMSPRDQVGRQPWAVVDLTLRYRKPLWWALAHEGVESSAD